MKPFKPPSSLLYQAHISWITKSKPSFDTFSFRIYIYFLADCRAGS